MTAPAKIIPFPQRVHKRCKNCLHWLPTFTEAPDDRPDMVCELDMTETNSDYVCDLWKENR